MASKLILLTLFCFGIFHVQVQSIGYYNRNIARKAYWLLANNLYRIKGSQDDFWKIVDDENRTKKQILLELGKWAETKGPYMVVGLCGRSKRYLNVFRLSLKER